MEREELDIHIKELQEKAEAFFAQAGQDTIEVYRIEKFEPVRQDPEFLGKFFDGDSYVILKQNEKDYDIHYWHGKYASSVSLHLSLTILGRDSNSSCIHRTTFRQLEESFEASPTAYDGRNYIVLVLV
jgi:hypothetical protein